MAKDNSTTEPGQYQHLFKELAGALNEHIETKGQLDEAKVQALVDQRITEARLPRTVEVHFGADKVTKLTGRVHCQFDELLALVDEGYQNILMVGPAGCGKTTLAKNLAEALSLDFGFLSLSAGVTETHLLGRMLPQPDGTWAYVPSRFVAIYESGGVFLLDEMDAADSNLMVAVNAAIANGVLSNPINGKLYQRHAQTIIVGAANTYGRGGDHQYVGRNQLDAATLDRFVLTTVFVRYDTDLEGDIVRATLTNGHADELLNWIAELRGKITENRLRRIASTRLAVHGAAAMKRGRTIEDVRGRYLRDWSADELAKIGGA